LLIAPSEEIAAQEKIDLEANKSVAELAPVHTVVFKINFAKATELAGLFTGGDTSNTNGDSGSTGSTPATGILSSRGSVIVDERTNTTYCKKHRYSHK